MPFPLTEQYIEKAESELGVRFPDSFRNKMMETNGGSVNVGEDLFELHPFYDTSDKKRIKRTCNSIVHETIYARTHYRLPDNLIIIGSNGGGDVLVYKIGAREEIEATIYWLDHETDELIPAANDFGELQINA